MEFKRMRANMHDVSTSKVKGVGAWPSRGSPIAASRLLGDWWLVRLARIVLNSCTVHVLAIDVLHIPVVYRCGTCNATRAGSAQFLTATSQGYSFGSSITDLVSLSFSSLSLSLLSLSLLSLSLLSLSSLSLLSLSTLSLPSLSPSLSLSLSRPRRKTEMTSMI